MKVYSTKRIALPKYIVHVTQRESNDYTHKISGVTKIEAEAHKHQGLPMMELANKLLEFVGVVEVSITTWDGSGVRVVRGHI